MTLSVRIVVKVGTSSLYDRQGQLDLPYLADLGRQLEALWDGGHEVILVTSGAIGLGSQAMGTRPRTLTQKQAMAAIGQARLIQSYQAVIPGRPVAQVLLTREDLESGTRRRERCRATLSQLLAWSVLPVVNENDTVADEEIRVGDNDTLAARVAVLMRAGLVVLLSDIDGYYTADPRRHPDAARHRTIMWVTPEMVAEAEGAGHWGTGGMVTKLLAARICQEAGIPLVLAHSRHPAVLEAVAGGDRSVGTWFLARPEPGVTGTPAAGPSEEVVPGA